MDISSLYNISSDAIESAAQRAGATSTTDDSFGSVFQSALDLVNNTNDLQNEAEKEEVAFALGETDSTHDLLVAQEKANTSLQYTVAVRDKLIAAYNEIMNMQI